MKIIVPILHDQVSQHFGQSPQLAVYEGEKEAFHLVKIIDIGEHQHTGVPTKIIELSADVVVCGNLGQSAKIRLETEGIRVVSGAVGRPEDAVVAFLNGSLIDRDSFCEEHQHQHHHHHEE